MGKAIVRMPNEILRKLLFPLDPLKVVSAHFEYKTQSVAFVIEGDHFPKQIQGAELERLRYVNGVQGLFIQE